MPTSSHVSTLLADLVWAEVERQWGGNLTAASHGWCVGEKTLARLVRGYSVQTRIVDRICYHAGISLSVQCRPDAGPTAPRRPSGQSRIASRG